MNIIYFFSQCAYVNLTHTYICARAHTHTHTSARVNL